MSYNSKLLQTGRKVASARRKYYGSFDYGSGIEAKLRGGTFSIGKKFWSGGDTWYGGKDSEAFKSKFLGSSSSGTNWSGLLGIGTGFIGDIFSGGKDMSDKYNSLMGSTTNFGNDYYTGIQDNSGLIAALQNSSPISNVSSSDIRNKSIGQDIGSALTTGLNAGMSTGNVWVGIGAAALDAGKSVLQRLQAQTYADRVNQYIKDKNIRLNQDAFMAGEDVDAHNDWMRMMNYYMNPYDFAFGGSLHSNGGDYNGGLTYIDEGGRHEDNPYEGVPSGVGADGVPNLVEEGEVIWNNDYVFSDRLKVPKKLAKKYKLGGDKDYTFAEAIEKLTKENTLSPNDFITIATTKEIVNEFMDAQEALREREQIKAREELETAQADNFLAQLDAAQGMAPQGMALPPTVGMPNEAPVTEGEMTPPGYALGGRMFKNGSKKEGEVKLPEGMKVVYSKGRNGQRGPVHHYESADGRNLGSDLSRAIQLFNAGNAATERRSPYSYPYRGSESPSNDPFPVYATPWDEYLGGPEYFLFSPNDGINETYTPLTMGRNHTIPFSSTGEYYNYDPGKPYVPSSEVTPPPSQAPAPAQAGTQASVPAPTPAGSPSSGTPQTGTQASAPQSGSGSSGSGSSSSARGIKYNRKINGKEFESQQHYQDFISSMDSLKTQDPAKAQEWIDYINQAIKDQGDKYHISSFEDWRDLALDGKVGPVHQATLKAAEYFARRAGAQAVGSGNPIEGEPTLESVLGVKPQTAKGISSVGTQQAGTTGATDTKVSTTEPRFKYRDTSLRYAPPIGAAMDLLYRRLNRPDYSNADHIIEASGRMGMPINIPVETIGDYRRRNPYDERYLVNLANQNRAAGVRTLVNTAGGNRSMDMLGAMSLAHSNQYDLGEIMRQAYLANRQDDAQVAEFNRGTNLYNMNAINQRNLSQAQINTHRQQAGLSGLTQGYGLRQSINDNWEDSAMESYNSLLASLGAIGKENEEYNMLQSMAEEGYFDHAYIDNGRIRFVPKAVVAKGGKLNRKKRRF